MSGRKVLSEVVSWLITSRRASHLRALGRLAIVCLVVLGQVAPLPAMPTIAPALAAAQEATSTDSAIGTVALASASTWLKSEKTPTPLTSPGSGPSATATPTAPASLPTTSSNEKSKVGPARRSVDVTTNGTGGMSLATLSYQTISSAGPLTQIYLGNDLSCQVAHVGDADFEFYPSGTTPGDCGTFLVVNGTLYAPDFASHALSATGDLGTYTPFTPVSQSGVTGSGTVEDPYSVTTVVDVGSTGLRITQVDSYAIGLTFYSTDIQVDNLGSGGQNVILFRAADSYLGNSDNGYGFVDTSTQSIGCSKTPNNDPSGRYEAWQPLTSGGHYYEAGYEEVWLAIGAKTAFNDTCRCSEYIDNGAGLSWSLSISNGSQALVSHLIVFTPVLSGEPVPAGTEHNSPIIYGGASRDPVHTLTGSYMYSHTDLAISGHGPSPSFTRAYNSNDTRVGPLGPGWSHNYNVRLVDDPNDGTDDLILVGPEGRSDRYTQNTDGSYSPPPGVYTTLVKNADGTYTATHPDQNTWSLVVGAT